MARIGVREIKAHLSDVLRRVEEHGETFDVTRHGTVIARIVPVKGELDAEAVAEFWRRQDELSAEISQRWTGNASATEAVTEIRRNLTPDEWVSPEWRRDE